MIFLSVFIGTVLGTFLGHITLFYTIGKMAERQERKSKALYQDMVTKETARMQAYAKMEG